MSDRSQTYADSGVDYSSIDPIKVLAQKRAQETASNLNYFNASEMSASRGESAYVWEENDAYRSLVIEGLGTKNLVADEVRKYSGKTHYDTIAQDAIAMIVNDLIVVGAIPQVVNAYWAIGESSWMSDVKRSRDLIEGWGKACNEIGATWGGGETPTLKDIINPSTIDIGGSAIGIIKPKTHLVLGDKLNANDAIVLIESSGIHANGITFVRKLAENNPEIYKELLPNGNTFGEALLTPTHLYVNLVKELLKSDLDIHYMVNITGHGWRKLMRSTKSFKYEIDFVPDVPDEFNFMQQKSNATDQEMYGNFNMGAGFAIYVPENAVNQVIETASQMNLKAWRAGTVKEGSKQVTIKSKNITYSEESLEVR